MDQTNLDKSSQRKGRWKLMAVLLVCAAPLIFSYLTYYVIQPVGRSNYGALIDPRQYPIPELGTRTLDGKPEALDAYQGKWIMLQVAPGTCAQVCRDQLVAMRQLRLMQGKARDRIERVWLITDDAPIDATLIKVVEGTRMLRADATALGKWLPVEPGGDMVEHLYLIDPLGNLMMRFPKEAEPNKVKKDMAKLLKASAIG